MPQEMSYAQALTEAKQVIIQQQYRIKADAEKIKVQQQTILDQSNALSEGERHLREQSAELQRVVEELATTHGKLNQVTTAREQAEAVVNRQGERITSLQASIAELEQRLADHVRQAGELTAERDALRAQLPTSEDVEALTAMSELLSRRPGARSPGAAGQTMRLATDTPSEQAAPAPQAEAA